LTNPKYNFGFVEAGTKNQRFIAKNCGLPFLTDRSGSNAQSIIFII
jgi:hypothetical protein